VIFGNRVTWLGERVRPRLKRTIELIRAPDGDLILMRPAGPGDIRIGSPRAQDRKLLHALDGSHAVAELEARFGARAVGDAIAGMQELDLIEDAADDDLVPAADMARFDRQLRYFSDLASSDGVTPSQCQARLGAARVAILGVGGLGGRVALELACCGVGELCLVDGDEVELSNLNRQIQFTEADIGASKAEAMAARLRAFNSEIRVEASARRLESQAELADFVAGADVVVASADWPAHEIEAWCNSACFELRIPYITMAQLPPKVRIGPFYVPGSSGCHECQQIAWRRDYPLFDRVIEQQKAQPSTAATLGPASGLIAAQVGMDVVHFLTGLTPPASLGAACMYDLRTMEVERLPVAPEPECPVCSHLREEIPAAN
jgi:bacteriocin biosynthesis cyclodehydratase domain-containing protein